MRCDDITNYQRHNFKEKTGRAEATYFFSWSINSINYEGDNFKLGVQLPKSSFQFTSIL